MAGEQKLEKPILEKVAVPLSTAEKIKTPETKTEAIPLLHEKKADTKSPADLLVAENTALAEAQAQAVQSYQQKRAKEIDNILSEGMNEIFLKMKPEDQKIFQKKGEETVIKINELLSQTKVKINKIVALIRKWLALVTGINKFFLEQEVKIKADKIIRLKDK